MGTGPHYRPPVPAEIAKHGAQPLGHPQHERFVQALVRGMSPVEAYREAGYAGWTSKQVGKLVAKVMRRAEVAARLTWLQARAATRAEIEAADVLRETALIGFSSIADYEITPDGWVRVVGEAAPEALRSVKAVRRRAVRHPDGSETVYTEFKLWSKEWALDRLGRHTKLWGTEHGPMGVLLAGMRVEIVLRDEGRRGDEVTVAREGAVADA